MEPARPVLVLPLIHLDIDDGRGQKQQLTQGSNYGLGAFSSAEYDVLLIVPDGCSPYLGVLVVGGTDDVVVDATVYDDAQIGYNMISPRCTYSECCPYTGSGS
jgi:hypothetical protein